MNGCDEIKKRLDVIFFRLEKECDYVHNKNGVAYARNEKWREAAESFVKNYEETRDVNLFIIAEKR